MLNFEEHKGLFTEGRKLASGHGLKSMGDKSYKNNWRRSNSILRIDDESDLNSKWTISERQRINYGKPASFFHKGNDEVKPYGYKRDIMAGAKQVNKGLYHQTAIARDIKNVKKRRG